MEKESPSQLTRLEVTVHGMVQRVGYRYIVQDMARKFNVKGYVQNMPDGAVKIIAEAPKKNIEKFIKTLQIREPPIYVNRMETKRTKPTTEFKFFSIKYGDLNEEMGEGFGTGLKYVDLSRAETKQGFQNLSAEMGQGFGSLKNEIGGMRKDMNKNFQDMSKKYDAISDNLGQAVKIIQDESVRTRNELIRAVDSLSKLVEVFVKEKRK